jgi:hypothetical protein
MTNNSALDPETADLVRAAFAKSWQFVRTDPELGHDSHIFQETPHLQACGIPLAVCGKT